MLTLVEAAGLPPGGLTVEERGEGTPVLLVHGTGIGRGLWAETLDALGGDLRAIAYDRRAYGGSGAPEPYGGTTVEEQTEDAAALLEARAGTEAAVVCGHDLGALVCLDLLRRHAARVRAAVLVEPPLLSLSARGPEAMGALREAVARGAGDGPAGAVDAYLQELGGAPLGPERLSAARAASRAFAADLAAAPHWSFTRRALRAVAAPAAVVSGRRARRAA